MSRSALYLFIAVSILLFGLAGMSGCSGDATSSDRSGQSLANAENPIETLPDGVFRLKKQAVIDNAGFGRSIVAAHVFVPVGWEPRGGVVWQINNRGCGRNGTRFEWAATSPDGLMTVEILPEETWGGNNLGTPTQGCPNVWLRSAREYLSAYVRENRSTATIRSYRDRADVVDKLGNLNSRTPMPMGELRTWVEAGEVILDYEYNGRAMEEILVLAIVFNLNRMQGVMPGEIREFITTSTLPGFSMRAPKGQLDLKLAETIRKSGQPNPEWTNLMAQHNAKMAQINRKGAMDRHRIRMEANREIAAMNQKSYENRQRTMDESNKKFNQMIRGVETYVDPTSSAKVELPYTHDNAWKLEDDTYLLTDNANFEPYRDLGVEGQKLQRER